MATNIADIEKALGHLKYEVADLHPHLKEFFRNLEGVIQVNYTHGQEEWGADFILSQKDSLTGEVVYVGVIVKNGSITQKYIDEVERQISECTKMPRIIENGAQRIRVRRVWVIANGNITRNAKEKIHENHQIGVQFTGRKDLATLMASQGYNFSGNLNTAVSICLSKQSTLAQFLQKQSVGLGFSKPISIFMDQGVTKRESMQYAARQNQTSKKTKKQKKTTIQRAIENNQTIILTGMPGCGKSKMLQSVLEKVSSVREFKKTKMIPIFITCKEIIEKHEESISQLVDNFEKEHDLKDVEIELYYMVIVDGIDEHNLFRDQRLEIIKKWKKEATSGKVKKMIFASRDYFDGKISGAQVYDVAGVSQKEIIKTIKENLSELDTVNQIVGDIQRSDIFRSLPKSPLATIILINLLKDEKGRHELPANLTELFAKYIECSLGRWDDDVEEGMKQKRYEAADKILSQIAVHMINSGADQLNEGEARKFFQNYLEERNLGIRHDELFDKVTGYSNLLYLHNGVLQFRHRTIAEFFYSKKFSDLQIDQIKENIFDVQWATILYFYVGLKKDCPELLEKINAITPEHESGKILKSIGMANILLAGYATPYDCVEKILGKVFVDTAQYLDDIINKKYEESPLNRFSTMRVLFLFRIIMDFEYSRHFFKNAIENSLIEMEDLDIDDNVKSTSLFLLNLAHASLGGENIFSGMVEKLGNKIPAHIRLAIEHETKSMKNLQGNVKKFKRTIKRSLLQGKKSDNVAYLYDKEIRYLPNPKNEN